MKKGSFCLAINSAVFIEYLDPEGCAPFCNYSGVSDKGVAYLKGYSDDSAQQRGCS